MFVYHFAHVHEPFAFVERRVLEMIPGLAGWASEAYREGEALRLKVGPGGGIAKEVLLELLGDPVRGESETSIAVAWRATGPSALFPRLQADIVVATVGPELTQISLRGSYSVPMGSIGRALDRVVLHRIAEATVNVFIDRIADAVGNEEVVETAGRGTRDETDRS